ncbi:MAG: phosphomannomutase/phosphoglucomutase, partial [Gammaproteobacteria bacterium]|nr:phosphomannomutase/phosphoglucomutase [Gammaproteobacteria bacterium]
SVLKAAKDLMTGKPQGNYPVIFDEMRLIITNLIQFKRVLDNGGVDSGAVVMSDDDDLQLDEFLDEPEGVNFTNPTQGIEVQESEVEAGMPVTLPESAVAQESSVASFEATDTEQKIDQVAAIFRAYDIRGIVDETLTSDVVYNIGRALGSEAKEKGINTFVIARDGRLSSPALAESLTKGIMSTGRNILDLGMVPTPVLYFVVQHTDGRTGVMVTGSHNPVNYNGLKMVVNGDTLAGEKIQALKQRIDREDYATGELGKIEQNTMFVNEYIGIILEDVHMARPMKVVLDCGNGVTGELGPTLLKTLGCEVIELFTEIDGHFPNHHPDPSKPENLQELITSVKHYEADIGIAFDGDGDRLGVVDSKGKIIWPDRQMMLFAKDVLAQKPGAEIIYDVKCSRHLADQIVKHGGRPVMWKTGHSLMKAKLKETAAKLAGEMSGHIFFNDRWFGFDDALYSAARIIEILSADSRTSREVFADFPDSINRPELNIELPEGENFRFMGQLLATADFADGKISNLDGMRVDFPSGWGLVRASNTTPSLVLRFEADTTENLA